jgi:hypothetical protein
MTRYQEAVGDVDLMAINKAAKAALQGQFASSFALGTVWASLFAILTLANLVIFCLLLNRLFQ